MLHLPENGVQVSPARPGAGFPAAAAREEGEQPPSLRQAGPGRPQQAVLWRAQSVSQHVIVIELIVLRQTSNIKKSCGGIRLVACYVP